MRSKKRLTWHDKEADDNVDEATDGIHHEGSANTKIVDENRNSFDADEQRNIVNNSQDPTTKTSQVTWKKFSWKDQSEISIELYQPIRIQHLPCNKKTIGP